MGTTAPHNRTERLSECKGCFQGRESLPAPDSLRTSRRLRYILEAENYKQERVLLCLLSLHILKWLPAYRL